MYAWGGSTKGWKTPGAYKYDSARAPYLDKLADDASRLGSRTYADRFEPDMKLVDPNGKTISSDSLNPLVVGIDVTRSMASWPREIFDRLPLLYQTLSQYRDDLEISFAAIGDANCDSYPLQVNDFGKGLDLEEHLKALYPEGGGGGQISETYELFGYFLLNHCNTPKATNPFLIIYGDEKFYNKVDPAQVEHYIGDNLQDSLSSTDVWKGLLQKFDLYFLNKPYHGSDSSVDREIREHWANAIGHQRIIQLPNAERAVDIAMGIIAKKWGQYGDFTENLGARHDSDVKSTVHATLRYIDGDPSTKSRVATPSALTKTKPLVPSKDAD